MVESAKWRAQRSRVPYVHMCLTCPTCPRALRGLRALRALRAHVPYVPFVPTRPTCPTRSRAQVYFTDRKIKNISFDEIK